MTAPLWTEQEDARLTVLWRDGLSASSVANVLALEGHRRRSRNAIIGRVHRIGLPGRAQPTRKVKKTTRKPRSSARYVPTAGGYVYPTGDAKPRALPRPSVTLSPTCFCTLKLQPHQCRWPIGDPQHEGFGYCARAAEGTYCDDHAAVAYTVSERKRRSYGEPDELRRLLRQGASL